MRIFKKIIFFLPLLFILVFCRKSNVASWDVDLILPVVSSELNIKNFLGDSIFKSDDTGLLNLGVTRTITAIQLDSLISLPDTTIVSSFTLPCVFGCTLEPGQSFPFAPSALTFSIGNEVALKKVDVRTGSLTVKFSNDLAEPMDLIYVLPGVTKNGEKLSIFETVPTGTFSLIKTYDLSNYSFNMTGGTGFTYNTLLQTYTLMVNPNASSVVAQYGQGVKIEVSYTSIVPDYVEGYFGKQTITVPADTTKLDILKNFETSNFMLSDASFNFKIVNEFGAEFSSSLSNIKAISGSSVVALNTSQLSNININRATKSGNTIYPSVKTVSLTPGNSNILNFLSVLPTELTYSGSVNVNPLGNIAGYNDFAYYNTGIKVLADINIPLRFQANYFRLVSRTKVDFSNVTQLDKVNQGQFIISASNGYPFSAQLQAFLIDEQNNIIDSLFVRDYNIIEQGITDNQNVVIMPKRSDVNIPLTLNKIENLKKSREIMIETKFVMPPNPPDIKIYEHYVFDVNIKAELNLRAERK